MAGLKSKMAGIIAEHANAPEPAPVADVVPVADAVVVPDATPAAGAELRDKPPEPEDKPEAPEAPPVLDGTAAPEVKKDPPLVSITRLNEVVRQTKAVKAENETLLARLAQMETQMQALSAAQQRTPSADPPKPAEPAPTSWLADLVADADPDAPIRKLVEYVQDQQKVIDDLKNRVGVHDTRYATVQQQQAAQKYDSVVGRLSEHTGWPRERISAWLDSKVKPSHIIATWEEMKAAMPAPAPTPSAAPRVPAPASPPNLSPTAMPARPGSRKMSKEEFWKDLSTRLR
jgi:hypothetical protein